MSRLSFLTKASIGVSIAIILVLCVGYFSYKSIELQRESGRQVEHTRDVIATTYELKIMILTMESAVRGLVLTRDDAFRESFDLNSFNVRSSLKRLEELVSDNPSQRPRIDTLNNYVYEKLTVMSRQIDIAKRPDSDLAEIQPYLKLGREYSRFINKAFTDIVSEEQRLLAIRQNAAEMGSTKAETFIVFGNGLFLLVILILSRVVRSTYLAQIASEKATKEVNESLETLSKEDLEKNWILNGALEIGAAMRGDVSIKTLTKNLIGKLSHITGADLAVLYVVDPSGYELLLTDTFGIDVRESVPDRIEVGRGILGQMASESIRVKKLEVVPGYFKMRTGVGEAQAGVVFIKSLMFDSQVIAVVEIGFMQDPGKRIAKLLEAVSESVSATIMAARERQKTRELLTKTQLQAEELLSQQEEMRVINEELNKQTSMLRVSDEELREQQEELKQINTELEEKAFLLEEQNSTIEEARDQLQTKADELERAGRFKSEFLANMSHELRTPLNSILILSQILRENKGARLSQEEARYASVINTSGNDLLTLINDILDLAKVEAGKVELHYEYVTTNSLLQNMGDMFQKVADSKGIKFILEKSDDCPDMIWTDPVRVLQITRNLISNSIKFTSAPGSVALRISKEGGNLHFKVSDTGIGIPLEKQKAIFEAFQQADGSTSRKYGGTGLGLSISKEFATLLKGRITLVSEADKGSEFCLIIPLSTEMSPVEDAESVMTSDEEMEDMLASHNGTGRLLIIEDDEIFAGDMAQRAQNFGFEVAIALTGKDGLKKVKEFKPNAITLDVFLPDISGKEVLNALKADPATRDIPVHVVSSGGDSLGADAAEQTIGIMEKPIDKKQQQKLFELLKLKGQGGVKQRILLVEDDKLQSHLLGDFLSQNGIFVLHAYTAKEATSFLESEKVDGIILDVNLSDRNGIDLLDDIKQRPEWSGIPVIINTAEDLSHEDLGKIMRYAHPIVMKTRKSNERLLDEVKQFLKKISQEESGEKVSTKTEEEAGKSSDMPDRGQIPGSYKILIADDDMRNIFALSAVLEEAGYSIEIAGNGLEVINKLNSMEKVDLILMDVMMPEMDGIEATKKIREESKWERLPIIAVTAKAMSSDRQLCLDAGANDYISKPVDVEKLMSLIKVWVHSS